MAHLRRFMYDSFLTELSRKPVLKYICLSIGVLTEMSVVHHTVQLFSWSPVPAVCAAFDSLTHCDSGSRQSAPAAFTLGILLRPHLQV